MLKNIIAASVAAAALAGTAAHASTLTFNGFEYGSRPISTTNPSVSALAGEFNMTNADTGESFLAYCIDLLTSISFGNSYSYDFFDPDTRLPGSDIVSNLQALYSGNYAGVDTRNESVAFQMAIWEIAYETDASAGLNVGTGSFGVSSNSTETNTLANQYLGNLDFSSEKYLLTFWDGEAGRRHGQDLVSAQPIPLPASAFLLLGGLGGLAAMRNRRKKAA